MNLKEKLIEQGIILVWLAERIGLSRPTLYKYLKRPDVFKVKHVRKICKYLDMTEREGMINYFKQIDSYE